MEPIAVLAGTPIDTQMGAEVLRSAGMESLSLPLARDPVAQTALQIAPVEKRTAQVRSVLEQAGAAGCRRAFVYCNSLSGTVDFPALARETGLRIVTPLEVYERLAAQYRSLGVIAANAQGLAGIERTLLRANPALTLWGASLLPAVLDIEAGETPAYIVEHCALGRLAEWFACCGAEALVLGCTHFPYFKDALAAQCPLPLIDPAKGMLDLLTAPDAAATPSAPCSCQ